MIPTTTDVDRVQALREARRLIRTEAAARSRHLRSAEKAYRAALERAEKARVARNRGIVDALDAGLSLNEVAEITGIGRARVWQIVNGWKSKRDKSGNEAPAPVATAGGVTTHEGRSHEQQAKR